MKTLRRPRSRTSGSIRALGTKHRVGTQYRHGGYLDTASDVQFIIEARTSRFEMGDFAVRHFDKDRIFEFVVPSGIGDVSWVYSKISKLGQQTGKEVLLYSCADEPRRSGPFIKLLPGVRWGGYDRSIASWEAITRCMPDDWPDHMGLSPLIDGGIKFLAPNLFLERGKPLRDWLPKLTTDYHYDLRIPTLDRRQGDRTASECTNPIIVVYVSNRDKERFDVGGWKLWSIRQWHEFLRGVMSLETCRGGTIVLVGERYDRDKTAEVARLCRKSRLNVLTMIGQPLGAVVRLMQRANYMFSYPSGLGILANVVRLPCLMLLPWMLRGLVDAYADPADVAANRYRAWPDPKPEEALDWFSRVGAVQAQLQQS